MNMQKTSFAQAQKMLSPSPFALLTSLDKENERTNLMAVSWWTFASNHPATIIACLSQKGLSGSLVKESGEFGLCMVKPSLKEAGMKCGACSGRTVNKAEEFGIALVPADEIAPQLVAESAAAFECRLIRSEDVQDHTLLIAEVVATHAEEGAAVLYAMDGYRRLETV